MEFQGTDIAALRRELVDFYTGDGGRKGDPDAPLRHVDRITILDAGRTAASPPSTTQRGEGQAL